MAGKKSSRNYSDRTLKILWGRSAGRCAVPSCRVEVFVDETEHDPVVLIGEIAHIEAASDHGPRANPSLTKTRRDEYDNLILLCKNCHARFDGQKNTNTLESIRRLKEGHEAWVRHSLPERGRSTTGWATILLQGQYPFDLEPAIAALIPDFPSGDPLVMRADPDAEPWDAIGERIASETRQMFAEGDPFDFRVAVFPLAPVSACVALGFHLTNRPRVRLFQYHRDDYTWSWPPDEGHSGDISVAGIPDAADESARDIAFCFGLSASVSDSSVQEVVSGPLAMVRLGVPLPSTEWLRHPDQLKELSLKARQAFEGAVSGFPRAIRWHLFYAGPAPGAVAVGQQLNPTMCPPVQLYEFRQNRNPAYRASATINGTQDGE